MHTFWGLCTTEHHTDWQLNSYQNSDNNSMPAILCKENVLLVTFVRTLN